VALEHLMEEDAGAGQPFIAALVISSAPEATWNLCRGWVLYSVF
jgi:hypothetical protein